MILIKNQCWIIEPKGIGEPKRLNPEKKTNECFIISSPDLQVGGENNYQTQAFRP
jgi:hypothetical protein